MSQFLHGIAVVAFLIVACWAIDRHMRKLDRDRKREEWQIGKARRLHQRGRKHYSEWQDD